MRTQKHWLATLLSLCLIGCGGGASTSGAPITGVNSYTIAGTVSGLTSDSSLNGARTTGWVASSLSLKNSNGEKITLPAFATNFSFNQAVPAGSQYSVTVDSNPNGQVCQVSNGVGKASANISNISVACDYAPDSVLPVFQVGDGTHTTGRSGSLTVIDCAYGVPPGYTCVSNWSFNPRNLSNGAILSNNNKTITTDGTTPYAMVTGNIAIPYRALLVYSVLVKYSGVPATNAVGVASSTFSVVDESAAGRRLGANAHSFVVYDDGNHLFNNVNNDIIQGWTGPRFQTGSFSLDPNDGHRVDIAVDQGSHRMYYQVDGSGSWLLSGVDNLFTGNVVFAGYSGLPLN